MTQHFIQLGQTAINAGNMAEAAQWFQKALDKNPKDGQSQACYGQSLCWLGQKKRGLLHLREAGRLIARSARKKKNASDLIAMTEQLQFWNDFEGAIELAKLAVQISKQEARSFQLLALSYFRLNKNKQAVSACQQALKLAPKNVELNILMAELNTREKKFLPAKQRLERMLRNNLTAEQIFRCEKELANILDKIGEYNKVFAHLNRSADIAFDIPEIQQQDAELVPNMLKVNQLKFTDKLLHRWDDVQFDDIAPVFVIGFMRSGTTLTQEVLDAHPDVFVGDEGGLISAMNDELSQMVKKLGSCAEKLAALDLDDIKHLRQFYWSRARAQFGDDIMQKCFVDKTTMATIDLGLINGIFPDAKIIFVIRDPRDVCLSCFMQVMEPTPSTVQILSWQKTVDFYAQTMDWWLYLKQHMALDFYELHYEHAVQQFEPAFRSVFDFLQLAWSSEVIEFHRYAAKKTINTPSFSQVTQPIYNSSIARWQHYTVEYQSVITKLEPYIAAFDYKNNQI